MADIADIINSVSSYSPAHTDASKVSFTIYDAGILAGLDEMAMACGVHSSQLAQIAMLRSILTCELPAFSQVMERLTHESRRWDMWMRFRLSNLDITVALWESVQ